MTKIIAVMSMTLDGFVADPNDGVEGRFVTDAAVLLGSGIRLFDRLAVTPSVLGDPSVIQGVGVTHFRCPVLQRQAMPSR